MQALKGAEPAKVKTQQFLSLIHLLPKTSTEEVNGLKKILAAEN